MASKVKKYKLKTNRSAKKRYKLTKSGKVLRTHAGKRHLNVGSTTKRLRKLRGRSVMAKADEAAARRQLCAT